MASETTSLRFSWWNLQDFAHYDESRAGEARWPLEPSEYEAKCSNVDTAIKQLIGRSPIDILGFCEITSQAAEDLRSRLFPEYALIYPKVEDRRAHQVAVLYRQESGFTDRLPLSAADVPHSTRPMAIVDHDEGGHSIRFVFCHWTSFGKNSPVYRERLAEAVSVHAYEFTRATRQRKRKPHVIILGDLNVEPFDNLFDTRLLAFRDRSGARKPLHRADHQTRRVKLYNAAWRHLGERYAHDETGNPSHVAGTYYNAERKSWHTYDQLLVSGSLIGSEPPFLEERTIAILDLPEFQDESGAPEPFRWRDGRASGLSDHLPVVGQLRLPAFGG
jgi:endonuclease/exonuclease/phosphatase family metal-dependent hydrolase